MKKTWEIIAAEDETPISVRYFYPGDTVRASYLSNGDGTGTWSMYDKEGQTIWTMPLYGYLPGTAFGGAFKEH